MRPTALLAACIGALLAPLLCAQVKDDRVSKLNAEGVRLFASGDFPQAIRLFQAALKLAPDREEIRTNVGKSYAALAAGILDQNDPRSAGRDAIRKALENLRLALIYWSGDSTTYHATGICHLNLGELASAESALTRAVALDGSSFRSWRLLGVIRERRGRLPEAIAALGRASTLKPSERQVARLLKRLRYDLQALRESPTVESRRFRVLYPRQLSREQVEGILQLFEKTCRELEGRWGLSAPERAVAICYPPGEFYRRTGFHEEVGGAFDGKIRIAFPAELEKGGLKLKQVVLHETVHLLLHRLGNDPPRWIDEGLAQVLDGEPREDWRAPFLAQVQGSPHLGILARNAAYREDRPQSWAPLYLHAYWLIRHLVETHNSLRLDMWVREAARGKSWNAAFEAVYGGSPEAVDRAFRRSLLRD